MTGEVRIHEADDACTQCWYQVTVKAAGLATAFSIQTRVEEAIETLINGIPTSRKRIVPGEYRHSRYQIGTSSTRSPMEWQPKLAISMHLFDGGGSGGGGG